MALRNELDNKLLINIISPAYIGNPKNNTIMYITKKIEDKIALLSSVKNCIVFVENNISIPEDVCRDNEIILSTNPAEKYSTAVEVLYSRIVNTNNSRRMVFTKDGFFKGENVRIGENTVIEPGAYIDHDVTIGGNCLICSGVRIRYGTIIGNNCIIRENTVIGEPAFNPTIYSDGSIKVIPSFGNVIIKNNVYIGANTSISRGGADSTIIDNEVKIDSNVRIGHDVQLSRGVEVISGSIVGGYSSVDENTVLSLNSTIKNRISIGKNAFVGMGSIVSNNVQDNTTVSCLPAETLKQIAKRRLLDIKIEKYLNEK